MFTVLFAAFFQKISQEKLLTFLFLSWNSGEFEVLIMKEE